MRRWPTSGGGATLVSGSIRIAPAGGSSPPAGFAVLALRTDGITVTETGVTATRAARAVRMYAEVSGEATGSAIALANPAPTPITAQLALSDLDGKPVGSATKVTIPAVGQRAMFLDRIAGMQSLPVPFQGIVRVSAEPGAEVAVVGLRTTSNERGDFLITATPASDDDAPVSTGERVAEAYRRRRPRAGGVKKPRRSRRERERLQPVAARSHGSRPRGSHSRKRNE